ncbi:MAG: hypothetical protein NTW55_06490 [Planctomycetota bacterium]|nr:hypothetical protein [Planctomycetota bacterium]
MSEKKVLSITLEVVALTILTVGVFWGIVKLLFHALAYSSTPIIFIILVGVLDIIYISTIKFWPLKNIHIKIIVVLLLERGDFF